MASMIMIMIILTMMTMMIMTMILATDLFESRLALGAHGASLALLLYEHVPSLRRQAYCCCKGASESRIQLNPKSGGLRRTLVFRQPGEAFEMEDSACICEDSALGNAEGGVCIPNFTSCIWGTVKIMVTFWVPIIIRGLIRGLI